MTIDELLFDIHILVDTLHSYERKYGVRSSIFYEAYCQGEEPADSDWVQDWAAWAGAYKVWLRREEQFRMQIETLRAATGSISQAIEKLARHESLSIPA